MALTTVDITTEACFLCGSSSVVTITADELAAMNSGVLIQEALPTRDASFRELLISGVHPDCWESAFGVEE